MTFIEFDKFQDALWQEVRHIRDTKGKEYANSTDRFANFDRLAAQLNLTNIQIAWVYTAKHLDSIAQYCRTGEIHSTEPIIGRIVDAITYLTLIAGMIEEKNGRQEEVNLYAGTACARTSKDYLEECASRVPNLRQQKEK